MNLKLAEPGQLASTLPMGWQSTNTGVGGYPCVVVNEKNETFVAQCFAVDGYEMDDAKYDWPTEIKDKTIFDSTEFRERFQIPEGYKFFYAGMNDTAEGGYALFTNGIYVREDVPVVNHDGDLWTGTEKYEDFTASPEAYPTFYPWYWTVFSDQ